MLGWAVASCPASLRTNAGDSRDGAAAAAFEADLLFVNWTVVIDRLLQIFFRPLCSPSRP